MKNKLSLLKRQLNKADKKQERIREGSQREKPFNTNFYMRYIYCHCNGYY